MYELLSSWFHVRAVDKSDRVTPSQTTGGEYFASKLDYYEDTQYRIRLSYTGSHGNRECGEDTYFAIMDVHIAEEHWVPLSTGCWILRPHSQIAIFWKDLLTNEATTQDNLSTSDFYMPRGEKYWWRFTPGAPSFTEVTD